MNSLPLLRRSALLPGESLPSLIERLVQLNYYDKLTVLELICRDRTGENRRDNITRPKFAHTFWQLSQLTMIDPEALFTASDYRFAPTLFAPGQITKFMPWFDCETKQILTPLTLQRRVRSSSAAQFCPLCLRETNYHRIAWIPIASAICLQHKRLLINKCFKCHKNISLKEIINKQCNVCNNDLSKTLSAFKANDTLGILSQQVIQSLLSIASMPVLPSEYTLYKCSVPVMFRLIDKLRICLFHFRDDWKKLPKPFSDLSKQIKVDFSLHQKMSPEVSYYLYRAAFYAVANWPQGFYSFIDACTLRGYLTESSSNMRLKLLELWFINNFSHPLFEFVLRALLEYSQTRGILLSQAMVKKFEDVPWFVEQVGLWTRKRTSTVLKTPPRFLSYFFPSSSLESLWIQGRFGYVFFKREKVLEIRKRLDEGVEINRLG